PTPGRRGPSRGSASTRTRCGWTPRRACRRPSRPPAPHPTRASRKRAAANSGRLVWGFDDASFLCRVTMVNNALVELQSRPPDDLHEPRTGQAVELLRSAVSLDGSGEYVASATGVLQTLTAPYSRDTHRITLPVGLPA